MHAGREIPVIVVADDDPAHRLLTVKAFERSRLRNPVKQVQDGEELLDYLLGTGAYSGGPPSQAMIILLDLNMPRKGGLEALAEIKNHPLLRRIPVVILTTSEEEKDVARCYDLGANSFISKPVDFAEFSRVVQQLGDYWLELVTTPPPAPQESSP
ncbi:MAG TPA: response regulator [Nevskia sp.]|jgi:CheY-like chemotaxis protein|nr:response regulator [Nevskia sp.]